MCSPCRGRGLSQAVAWGPGGAGGTHPSAGAGARRPQYKLGRRSSLRLWWVSHLDKAPQHLLWSANYLHEAGVSGSLVFWFPPPPRSTVLK